MRSVLPLNLTDKQQSYHGSHSTCGGSDEDNFSQAELFNEQFFKVTFLSNPDSTAHAIFILNFLISIVGIVGNGCVIWLLGFCIERNNFTIYVLNLAIADLGMLISALAFNVPFITILKVADVQKIQWVFWQCSLFTYSVGLYLVTAIGIERCLCILFPIWARCHRPKHLSITVSVTSWIVSALFCITEFLLHYFCLLDLWFTSIRIMFSVNLFILTPVMVVSTLILFIKMSFRHQPGKLHTIILIILIFFVITAIPYGTFFFMSTINYNFHSIAVPVFSLLVILNSSINSIIYFFVGIQCNCKSCESIKVVFQRIFKDETEHAETIMT
ncbi:mas-related G-protein coupled receptor member H-like [Anolis sagrei]|uniref:mas-related G-protein coupled receptor member H-like n=1 Tax=Anolis sagrei TaxID=38937 RepID=UPI0035223F9B